MWVLRAFFAFVLVSSALIALAAQGQAPLPAKPDPTPIVSELDALRLDKALVEDENFQLRIAQLQAEHLKHRERIQILLKSLEQPGHTLSRQATGTWIYMKKPEPPKAGEKKDGPRL